MRQQHNGFSVVRWWSIVGKEFTQLRRDRLTFAMILRIPLLQMALFGYAINTDPKHLDTATIRADDSGHHPQLYCGVAELILFQGCR